MVNEPSVFEPLKFYCNDNTNIKNGDPINVQFSAIDARICIYILLFR